MAEIPRETKLLLAACAVIDDLRARGAEWTKALQELADYEEDIRTAAECPGGGSDWTESRDAVTLDICSDLRRWLERARAAPAPAAASTDPAKGTACHACAGFVGHPDPQEACIRRPGCVGIAPWRVSDDQLRSPSTDTEVTPPTPAQTTHEKEERHG